MTRRSGQVRPLVRVDDGEVVADGEGVRLVALAGVVLDGGVVAPAPAVIVAALVALLERKANRFDRVSSCEHAAEALGMLGPRASIVVPDGVHPSAVEAIIDEGAEMTAVSQTLGDVISQAHSQVVYCHIREHGYKFVSLIAGQRAFGNGPKEGGIIGMA